MCLIAIAYKVHPGFPLVVAANRDEFLERDADPARFWVDHPVILAGRDRKAMGTWMGVTRYGRFAAITNHRDLRRQPVHGPSRGLLVRDALLGDPGPDPEPMEGYNLLYGAIGALRYRSNISGADHELEPGVHGLSNALLDTPWPKVERAKAVMAQVVGDAVPSVAPLFELLGDQQQASDAQLPDTGVGIATERVLSAIRIELPNYGTRCSTVIIVDADGRVRFEERTLRTGGVVREEFLL